VNVNDLGLKLISMGCDDNNVFESAKVGVTTYMKEIVVPFMIKIHSFVHQMNLAMLVLSILSLVTWLEVLLQAMYVFFLHLIKKFLEFQKLCDVLT
jgi:hypothetical protein